MERLFSTYLSPDLSYSSDDDDGDDDVNDEIVIYW